MAPCAHHHGPFPKGFVGPLATVTCSCSVDPSTGTMGFVLNERGGQFLRLTPGETDALHECLQWGRQPGNNKVLEFFGTTYEGFHGVCKKMMERFRSVLPEGMP